MNKTIASVLLLGLASAPALAEVAISGDQIWAYHDNQGATSTEMDGDINFRASTTTETGLSVSADFNINESADNDGGNSLTVSGFFGKLDLGDTSSATDAIDDVTDWGYFRTSGTDSPDHAVLYTAPSIVPGLVANVSFAADANQDSNSSGTGYSIGYTIFGVTAGYGALDNDDNTTATLMNASAEIAGFGVAYELYTTTDASNVDTDNAAYSVTFGLGPVTLGYERLNVETAGVKQNEVDALGVHYAVFDELIAFAETSTDNLDQSTKTTTLGLAYSF
jgi:hypothetical protein